MKSVADCIRYAPQEDVLKLSVPDRIALSLRLGEEAVRAYASANNVSEEEARRAFRRHSQIGRRYSAVASYDDE